MTDHLSNARRLFEARLIKGPDCWILTTAPNSAGYSEVRPSGERWLGHRIAYELYVGPIPSGLHIDHLCRNRRCVNPDHLEAVTQRENSLRGNAPTVIAYRTNTCKRGHRIEGANEYIRPDTGRRMCWACQRMRQQQVRARKARA